MAQLDQDHLAARLVRCPLQSTKERLRLPFPIQASKKDAQPRLARLMTHGDRFWKRLALGNGNIAKERKDRSFHANRVKQRGVEWIGG